MRYLSVISRCCCRSQPLCLFLKGVERWPNFQIPRAATFDRHCQVSIAKCRTRAIPFKDIAYLKMEFDVALQQVTAPCSDPAHDAVLHEDNCISPALLPRFKRAQPSFTRAAPRS